MIFQRNKWFILGGLYCAILLSTFRSFAITFTLVLIVYMVEKVDFLYALLILLVSKLFYSSEVSLYKILVPGSFKYF